MNQPIVYKIIGDPIPWARPRINGPARIFYDKQRAQKFILLRDLHKQHIDDSYFSGPCHLDVVFYLRIPKLSIKKMVELEGKPHTMRVDLDNMIKFICDLISMKGEDDEPGLLMKDDSIISTISARKVYSLEPRTEFTITEIK